MNIELPDPDCYPHLVELVREGVHPGVAASTSWCARCCARSSCWGCSTIPTSTPPRPNAWCASRRTGPWRSRPRGRRSRCSRTTAPSLPLDAQRVRRIAVIGPNADREMLGGYSGVPMHADTVLEGIRARVAGRGRGALPRRLQDHDRRLVAAGRSDAADPGGEPPQHPRGGRRGRRGPTWSCSPSADNEQTSREAWMANHLGDRPSLDLVGQQDELVEAVAATGKPVVVLLFNGRPLSIRDVAEQAAAILELLVPRARRPGTAVAEVLFGDVNPGGKLPITIPRSVGHVPAYYNYKPSARRGYLFDEVTPLFPFGFGLSYTTFAFENLRLENDVHRRRRHDAGVGGRRQHGPAGRRRSRAALHPRPRQQRHAAGEGAERVPAHHARARAQRRPSSSTSRLNTWRATTSTWSGASSPASSESWSAPRPATRICRRSRCE